MNNIKNNYKLNKRNGIYELIDVNTNLIVSSIKFNIFDDIKNFDWILINDVITNRNYRKQGLADYLLKILLNDLKKNYPKMGQYLFVLENNKPAIELYKKNNFKLLKSYNLNNKAYLIMYYGNADINQLKRQKFSENVNLINEISEAKINKDYKFNKLISKININLLNYIKKNILPKYNNDIIDDAHKIDHIIDVINFSLDICYAEKQNLNISFAIAAYHDIGLLKGDREYHHINSGKFVEYDRSNLLKFFASSEIDTIKLAVEEHRASIKQKSNIYSKIVSDADRCPSLNIYKLLERSWKYNYKNSPSNYTNIQIFEEVYSHCKEKYGNINSYGLVLYTDSGKKVLKENLNDIFNTLKSKDNTLNILIKLYKDGKIEIKNDDTILNLRR